jgi:hypothetical protein
MTSELAGSATAWFIIFFILIFFLVVILAILALIFWIFMIVDCAKRKFKDENEKVVWIIVIVFANWIGALIYYFVVKRPNRH